MLDSFRNPQSVALIGASSEIGTATVLSLPRENLKSLLIAGRDPHLSSVQFADLGNNVEVVLYAFDALNQSSRTNLVDSLFAHGDLDVAIIAIGKLGIDESLTEVENLLETATVNYLATIHLLKLISDRMKIQAHGAILVISSFAQTRPRVDNYMYGSTKAGLDFYARGLQSELAGTGVSLSILRPGFVHTKMTKGLAIAPFSISPQEAGAAGASALRSGAAIVYAPKVLNIVATIFRLLPNSLAARLQK